MSTTSTAAIYTQLRNRVLGFIPVNGNPVSGSLGSRLYVMQSPDVSQTTTFPYAVMRLSNNKTNVGGATDRQEMDLEIQLYSKPRSQQAVLENIADTIDASLLRYTDASSGLMFSRNRTRDSIKPLGEPVDREIVTIYLSYHLIVWPVYLTQYAGIV